MSKKKYKIFEFNWQDDADMSGWTSWLPAETRLTAMFLRVEVIHVNWVLMSADALDILLLTGSLSEGTSSFPHSPGLFFKVIYA